ncbi:MAG: TonB-dependent receptor, partial [Ignavibacteria bacterium]|nr:TonB-dependent receptor [Ignavibacteria bacterium]
VSTSRPYLILANGGGDFEKKDGFGLDPLLSSGTGYSKGIELFIQKALTTNYFGTLSLSLFEAKYTALDSIERESDFNNRFIFTLVGGYSFGKEWEVSSKFRFTGGRPYTPANPEEGTKLVSQFNSSKLPNYSSLDVRLDKRWNFKGWTLITYIDIQNIFDNKNVGAYEWNKFTRQIEPDESIGRLPTIGINAMF